MDNLSRTERPGILPLRAGASLLFGFFLFWLIRTGIQGKLFGIKTLFTFISDGTFLFGKLLLLLVCVALCLLLGLTAFGRAVGARLNKASHKNSVLWLISLGIVAVFFLWTLRIAVLSFMTSDESGILASIFGVHTHGLDYASSTFSHVLFCGLIGSLYGLDPDAYWYTYYHLFALLGSLVIIGRCILLKARERGWPLPAGVLLHFVLCAGVFMYAFAQISFTVTPAVVGSAAVALTLCRSDIKTTKGRILSDIGCVLLMLLCVLQRSSTGDCLLCFWALACVYQLAKILFSGSESRKRELLHLGIYILILVLLLGACELIADTDSLSRSADFANAEYYRSLIVDYLITDLTPEHFESAGIPSELATLLRGWYFMDERITTDTFKALARAYYADNPSSGTEIISPTVVSGLRELYSSVKNDPQMLYRALCLLSLVVFSLGSFIRHGRKYWAEFLCALCACGGAGILCLYLVMEGRFPTRVFLVVILPAIVTALIMALSSSAEETTPKKRALAGNVLSALAAAAFCVFCGISLFHVPYATSDIAREDLFGSQWATENYANENPDITYITNIYDSNLDPLHVAYYPDNIVLWGDGGDTYRTNRLYGPDFFRDDIRFMCQNPSYIMFLLQYLTLDNGPVQALDEAHLTDFIYVYDLSPVTPGEDYTGWYEQNGMTYYFEDGSAVTGTKVIDGEEYQFAPAGAASPMTRLDTEAGTVYTTKAYALIEPAA